MFHQYSSSVGRFVRLLFLKPQLTKSITSSQGLLPPDIQPNALNTPNIVTHFWDHYAARNLITIAAVMNRIKLHDFPFFRFEDPIIFCVFHGPKILI